MGEAERHGEYKRVRHRFSLGYDGNAVTTLLILNLTFFFTAAHYQSFFLL